MYTCSVYAYFCVKKRKQLVCLRYTYLYFLFTFCWLVIFFLSAKCLIVNTDNILYIPIYTHTRFRRKVETEFLCIKKIYK